MIAVDNDRIDRKPHIFERIEERIGPKEKWPIQGAVAVPVEMIEAWALLASGKHGPDENLPRFSLAASPSAKKNFGPNAPPQLKDLVELERKAEGIGSHNDYMLQTLLSCEPAILCQRSASFRDFYDQVSEWNTSD